LGRDSRDCDQVIRAELVAAGIHIVKHREPLRTEVPATISGKLVLRDQPVAAFVRGWYYWKVDCSVPLEVAEEIHANPVGVKDVRVAGFAGRALPKEWAMPGNTAIADAMDELGIASITDQEMWRLYKSGKIKGPLYIKSYHIDSQEGLALFVSTMRKHGLAD